MSARPVSRDRDLLHSWSAVAERTVANREAIADREAVANYKAIAKSEAVANGIAVTDCEAVAKRKAVAEQDYVAEQDRSTKQRGAVVLHHVIAERDSFDPHVVVKTLTRHPFRDAVAEQITLTVTDL